MNKIPEVYVVSDSLGDTAESVAKATISQFDEDIDIVRVPFIRHAEQIQKVIEEAAQHHAVVCHTLVSPELRQTFEKWQKPKRTVCGYPGTHDGHGGIHFQHQTQNETGHYP